MSLATIFATKVSADLIKKVAATIFKKYNSEADIKAKLGDLMPQESDLVDGITRLLKEGALDFGGATKLGDFDSAAAQIIGNFTNAVMNFQLGSGGKLKVTKLFDIGSIRRLLTRPACGGVEGRKLDPGPPIEVLPNGRHVMRYFLESLPNVGSPLASMLAFMTGVESWAKHLNLEISQETGDKKDANLIVTCEVLDADWSVLALTDIGSGGPNQGGQLRMMFDKAEESWTAEQLQATTAHELGHALGIRHADVSQSGSLMNDTLDLGVKEPTPADVAAAITKGWGPR